MAPSTRATKAAAVRTCRRNTTTTTTAAAVSPKIAKVIKKKQSSPKKPPPQQKQRSPAKKAAVVTIVVDDDDVKGCAQSNDCTIDLTTTTAITTSSESLLCPYLQALGPIRMAFVTEWKCTPNTDVWFNQSTATTKSSKAAAASAKSSLGKVKQLYEELVAYQINLPITPSSSIFVRVEESQLDLLRVLITGPEGTPYANGCFFFDVRLHDYPQSSPKVKFLTTGKGAVRFNPNLYNCGKVCLSLLGTWSGPGWIPNQSTLLQVLVSIQGLILVPDPYFNEPGFEASRGTKHGTEASDKYTKQVRSDTLKHAIDEPLQQLVASIVVEQSATMAAASANDTGVAKSPTAKGQRGGKGTKAPPKSKGTQQDGKLSDELYYPEFKDVMIRHFALQATALEAQLSEWKAADKTLVAMCNRIRKNLSIVIASYEEEKAQECSSTASLNTAGVAFLPGNKRVRRNNTKKPPPRRPDQELVDLVD